MASRPSCPCEGRTLDRHLQPTILAYLADGPEHGYAMADRLSGSPLMNGGRPDRPGRISVSGGDGKPGARQARSSCIRKWTSETFVPTDADWEGMPSQMDRHLGTLSRRHRQACRHDAGGQFQDSRTVGVRVVNAGLLRSPNTSQETTEQPGPRMPEVKGGLQCEPFSAR